ncbi:VOC family protein [Arthrobacter sunyaminii]|uniref:VOC family protein n=1 Tax=Arthrobacter sunyaminii TaxID=2816859 RepID=A0A975S8E0_9MICC|nr:VOC family protein [Arthrobacter sunyaminii]MBO0906933.1 VOC family protein [Arthrobacter sunyaminii]QWQ37684.1 VOC family protein [Arthrobacter sunyaminii]
MTAPMVYVLFPGTAREALTFYAGVFGGELSLHTNADFGSGGPPGAIAHGVLDGVVTLAGADAGRQEKSVQVQGVMLSLLGTAEPALLHKWFAQLSDGGRIVDPLAPKAWGASDGQVVDRYGLHWLIGYEPAAASAVKSATEGNGLHES